MKVVALLYVISYLFLLKKTHAQPIPEINFTVLSTANGLPTNLINSVFKDSRGLLWISTKDNGLLRYDGKKIKSFTYLNNGNGLSSNYVDLVCEDKQGWLWISTLEGLCHMNPVTEEIETFRHKDGDENSLAADDKPGPFIDSRGRIWITGVSGLQQYDPSAKNFINYSSPPISNPAWQGPAKAVKEITEDSKHRLWAGSAYGVYLVDTITHSLKPYFTGKYMQVTGIMEDSHQQLWVSSWGDGLQILNRETGRYHHGYMPAEVTRSPVLWEDENKKEWLCFMNNNHLVLADPLTTQYSYYLVHISKTIEKNGRVVNSIYADDEKRLWICTNTGIIIVDKKLQQFRKNLLFTKVDGNNFNAFGEPKFLLTKPDEYLLSTWYIGKLYRFDKNWELKSIIKSIPPNSKSIYSRVIQTIQQDEHGNTWYGTDSGLVKQTANAYTTYLPTDSFPAFELQFAARDILKRDDGLYWARFSRRGLYVFDAANGKFYRNYRQQYDGDALCITYDKTGTLWLGTTAGLYSYKQALDSFVRMPVTNPAQPGGKHYNFIYQLFFDENNIGWLGTFNGLVQLNPATGKLSFISDPLKPGNYLVCRLIQDTTATLWLLSNSGIIAYNKRSKAFRYFTALNGLPENFGGFPGVFTWLNDSTIAAGSTGIITTFNPYRLTLNTITGPILILDISIDNKRIVPANSGQKKLIVPPGANTISIHFALLNYTASQQNKLYYRLLPDKNKVWNETNDGDITLLNLPPGKYLLQVKGVSNGNVSGTNTDEVIIIVQPHWYQSAAFKVLLLLALVALLYLFIQWRVKVVKKGASLKQLIAQSEIAALKAQMNPHFIFNCINSIDALIQSNDKYNATIYLNKFAKLIRNVLDSSKQNVVAFSKDVETLKLYIELEQLRNENKFISRLDIDEELMNSDHKVPPLIIQPFVENAIIHGLRNKEGNDGQLLIKISQTDEHIIYSIRDNGIGRQASQQINTGKEKSYGLEMSYDRIKLFNAEDSPSVVITDLSADGKNVGTHILAKLKKA